MSPPAAKPTPRIAGPRLSALLALGTAIAICAAPSSTAAMGANEADADCGSSRPQHKDCGTHNMLVVGQKSMYVSHLPMFGSEHRFQSIVEVNLEQAGRAVDELYLADRKNNRDVRMYTLSPTHTFVLSRLIGSGRQATQRNAFNATVFRGHLERGGEIIKGLEGVDVHVKRVIYARELPAKTDPKVLSYILFGRGEDLYLAHQIGRAPDFDQVIGVTLSGRSFSDEELERGVTVTVPGRANLPASRLKAKETVSAQGRITSGQPSVPLKIAVGTEYYFEEGELRVKPDMGRSTPEEIKAGFCTPDEVAAGRCK